MNLFMYILRVTRPELLTAGPTDEEAAVIARHEAFLTELRDAGNLVLAGRTSAPDYGTYAVIVLRAESEAAARRIVSGDPVVAERVMRAELDAYRVSLAGDLHDLEPEA